MTLTAPVHAYRIRWKDKDDQLHEVTAQVDHKGRCVTVDVPSGEQFTVDVIASRAVSMVLSDAVYRALRPDGPLLALEVDAGNGWTYLWEGR